jgi:hypothetical protein
MTTNALVPFLALSFLSAQAQPPALKQFDSPEAAANAAIAAAGKNDIAELGAIFGPNSKAILTSGDPSQDEKERAEFARVATAKHRIERDPMNLRRVILAIGPEDWPFPVPIVEKNGKWSFDPTQGELEVRARRIGENEIDTIEACAGLVEAQRQYAEADRDKDGILEYAEFIMSSPGKTDGLYSGRASAAQVPREFAEAEVRPGNRKPAPYHGYYFRILTSQGPHAAQGPRSYMVKGQHMMGGFALVAWPAEYGITGVHTFLVNQDGSVFEKDLGKPASNLTSPVKSFDPDKSWVKVD